VFGVMRTAGGQCLNTGSHCHMLVYTEVCNLLHILLIFTETAAMDAVFIYLI
jgi:hypothetical protein